MTYTDSISVFCPICGTENTLELEYIPHTSGVGSTNCSNEECFSELSVEDRQAIEQEGTVDIQLR